MKEKRGWTHSGNKDKTDSRCSVKTKKTLYISSQERGKMQGKQTWRVEERKKLMIDSADNWCDTHTVHFRWIEQTIDVMHTKYTCANSADNRYDTHKAHLKPTELVMKKVDETRDLNWKHSFRSMFHSHFFYDIINIIITISPSARHKLTCPTASTGPHTIWEKMLCVSSALICSSRDCRGCSHGPRTRDEPTNFACLHKRLFVKGLREG